MGQAASAYHEPGKENEADLLLVHLQRDIFVRNVADYLGRIEVQQTIMKISPWVDRFRLQEEFCDRHGTRLECSHGERFTPIRQYEENMQVNSSLSPKECIDCAMQRIDHYRCLFCDEFVPQDHFTFCEHCQVRACNTCQRTDWCQGCFKEYGLSCEQLYGCDACQKNFCACTERMDCSHCEGTFCTACRPDTLTCSVCDCAYCRECQYSFACNSCGTTYCEDCKDSIHCAECEQTYCDGCRQAVFCNGVANSFCEKCRSNYFCEICQEPKCDDCNLSFFCEVCQNMYCALCKKAFYCQICEEYFCLDCRDANSSRDACLKHTQGDSAVRATSAKEQVCNQVCKTCNNDAIMGSNEGPPTKKRKKECDCCP